MRLRIYASIFFALLSAIPAAAHQVDSVELEFLETDGKWRLEGLLDIAYMLPESRGVDEAPPLYRKDVMAAPKKVHDRICVEAERTMRKLLTIKYNDETLPWEIRFPNFEKEPLVLPPEEGGWALMKAEITFPQKPGPGRLQAFWNDDQSSELIIIIDEGESVGLLSISSGMSDTLLAIAAPIESSEPAPDSKTPTKTAQSESWIISGYGHVISHDFFRAIKELRAPEGLDHLLFILGLFLLAPRWKPLLGQSLTFTLAHSITLALAILGFITLPSKAIEILIAASIAWIGIENIIINEFRPSRLYLVFGFGLLHGLGFASMLREKLGDLSGSQVALPLISFNVGVELAQITVIICAFAIFWPLRKWSGQVRMAGSLIVALAGLFWMIERIAS